MTPTRAEQYLRRPCYGKQYGDHDTVCPVCPLDAAFLNVQQDAIEACVKVARDAIVEENNTGGMMDDTGHWHHVMISLEIGEVVEIKGEQFKVVNIQSDNVILRSKRLIDLEEAAGIS